MRTTPEIYSECPKCRQKGQVFALAISGGFDVTFEAWYCLGCDYRGVLQSDLMRPEFEIFSWTRFPGGYPDTLPFPWNPNGPKTQAPG